MAFFKQENFGNDANELHPTEETMIASLKHLSEGFLWFRKAYPENYTERLEAIFSLALNENRDACHALINQLVELLGPTYFDNLIVKIISGQYNDLQKPSPFRQSLKKLLDKWYVKVENKLCLLGPDPIAWSERRIQAGRLKKALEKHIVDKNCPVYPDTELVALVKEILENGKKYYNHYGLDNGFNGFLDDLKIVSDLRVNGSLTSSENFFYGPESFAALLIIQNKKLVDQIVTLRVTLVETQSKKEFASQNEPALKAQNAQLYAENTTLRKQIADLQSLSADNNHAKLSDLIKLMMEKNLANEATIRSQNEQICNLLEEMDDELTSSCELECLEDNALDYTPLKWSK